MWLLIIAFLVTWLGGMYAGALLHAAWLARVEERRREVQEEDFDLRN